jgi:hypothetical protein
LESPSPSRRIFIGSHSLPPSLLHRIGPSTVRKVTADSPKIRPEQSILHLKIWTVRPARTVRQPGADSPTNLLQLKTPNSTDRDKPTHELATNMTTTDYRAPRGEFADQAWTVRQVRIEQLEFENASTSSPIHPLISQTT